uniref:Rubisco LSMT substrate-binding domain-containing protein n=1 Tax=Guillardia theta TaxID=55529 RepID=A0A7S4NB00_GUITH
MALAAVVAAAMLSCHAAGEQVLLTNERSTAPAFAAGHGRSLSGCSPLEGGARRTCKRTRQPHHRMSPSMQTDQARAWKSFEEWAEKAGIQNPTIKMSEFASGLRGMKAISPVSSGDILVTVPSTSVLRVVKGQSRLPSRLKGYVSEGTWQGLEWWAQLAVLLLWEKGHARSPSTEPSSFVRWIEVLPKSLSTPFHWNEESVKELQYQPLIDKIEKQKREWRSIFDKISCDNPQFQEADFYNACEMARSRAFSGPYVGKLPKDQMFLTGLLVALSTQLHLLETSQAALGAVLVVGGILANTFLLPNFLGLTHYVIAPMIDMINHDGQSKSIVTYQALQAAFEVQSSSNFNVGDQVFISYGDRSNDQLLQYYGFVEMDNVHDLYEIADLDGKLRKKGGKGGSEVGSKDAYVSPKGLDEESMNRAKSLFPDEASARQAVKEILQDELNSFPTTLEEDEVALRSRSALQSSFPLALSFRVSKKRLLHQVLQQL